MRPQIIILDRHGAEYDATHISIVKDGSGYALSMEVNGVPTIIEQASIASIRLVGWGAGEGLGGSDRGPWGRPLVSRATKQLSDSDLLSVLEQGLRAGRYRVVDSVRVDDSEPTE